MRTRVWARALVSAAYLAVPAGGAAITAASCADLEDIELGRCGNRVLDEGEDCDGHDDASGSVCAPPSDRNACRFTCSFASPETSTPCPEGTRCGVGDVCSRPSNVFTLEEAALVARGGDAFAAADFDGDRLTDVAIVSEADGELFVSFLGGLSPILETSVPVTPTRTMAVGRIDTDARPDVALGADAAVASLGSASGRRELVSTAFAQYDFGVDLARVVSAPAQSNVYPNPPPAQAKLEDDADSEAVILNFASGSQLYIRNPYDGSTASTPLLPQLTGLVGQTRGNVYTRTGPACDEIALAFPTSVVVVKLCDTADGTPLFPLPDGQTECLPEDDCIVTEAINGEVLGVWPAQLAEEDMMMLDPEVELAVLVKNGSALDLRIVEADPAGLEPLRTRPVEGGVPSAISAINLDMEGAPLYIGDLNGDAEIDAITPKAVHLSNGGASYIAAVGSVGNWDEVAVGDFNDDGLRDIAAGRGTRDAPVEDLDVMLGSTSSYYNPVILPTDGKASVFGVGDFDGDGIDDLVFRSRAVDLAAKVRPPALPSCTDLDDLRVFFGSDSGLGESSTLGKISGIEQLVVGRLPRLDKRDGISDFGLVSHCLTVDESGNPEPDSNRITVFYGALSRQVAAPYLLNDTRGGDGNATLDLVPFRPAAIAAREMGDVRVVATAAERLDAYASNAAPLHPVAIFALETRDGVVFKTAHYVPASLERDGLSIALGNMEGDGQLEIAVADRTALQIVRHFECFPGSYETSVTLDKPSEVCQLSGPDAPVSTDQLSASFVTDRISTPVDSITGLDAADLDRDGYDDLVVFGASGGVPAALVIWGGAFDPAANTLITLAGAGAINAAAFLPSYPSSGAPPDGTAVPIQLLLSVPSESGFALTAIELSGREVVTQQALATVGEVTDLAVADIDGDGFEDVAALTTQAVRVLRREPVLAGDRPETQAGGDE
jgi:hypothetical protein